MALEPRTRFVPSLNIILHHLGINGTIILKMISIINSNNNFVKINTVIVLKTKCIVMEKILNGCIRIAKELAESAMEDSIYNNL